MNASYRIDRGIVSLPILAGVLLAFVLYPLRAQTAVTTGAVEGSVVNAATKVRLRGAVVEIPALGRQVLSDDYGRFVIVDLPAGEHTLVTSYLGLLPERTTVAVGAGQRVTRDFELTADIYKLEAFRVAGEREGNAAAITRQRHAPNVKNVVSLDAGNLLNENPGDLLATFVPGVMAELNDDGDVTSLSIRGAASALNTISIDGTPQASTYGFNRGYRMFAISGALFDEIEVTKAPTPDMPADSLGGAVNMKTRSTLGMTEKRRFTFKAATRWAPELYDNIPARSGHRFAPQLSGSYQERFDVFGRKRNLGVSLNVFYNENVNGTFTVTQDYAFTTTSPAYIWDYRNFDQFFNRRQRSANLKLEYRLSDHATVVVNTLYNEPSTLFDHRRTMRAFTGRTLATIGANGQPTGTGAIMPGYTSDFTEVRAVPASTVQLNASLFDFLVQERKFDVGLRHEYDRWSLDYDLGWNYSHPVLGNSRRGNAGGGVFTMDVMNVGWILDKSRWDDFPTFAQTAGASIFDGASYGNGLFVTRDNDRFTDNINASVNARYSVPSLFGSTFKAGARYRSHEVEEVGRDRRWNWVGGSLAVLTDPNGRTSFGERLGRELPFPSPAFIGTHIRDNPGAWREDHYFAEMSRFSGTRDAAENITAGYASAEGRIGALSVLAGVRVERTEVESNGYVGSRVRTTTAQRNADPIGSARADFDNPRHLEGSYTDWFPGVHLKYRGASRWQARLSWSNSVGRPTLTNYLPLETPNTTAETLTVNNASLKPQYTENFDASLEYYFEPVGLLSLGVFRKNIDSYIVRSTAGIVGTGVNNGYNGNYEGYTLISSFNGGWAEINGFEANYQQQLSFLPGLFKGLGVFANYTKLKAEGNFGGEAVQSTSELADFMPEAMNAGVSYRYRGFNARVRMNYSGSFLTDYSADASRLRYRASRTAVNASVSYQWATGLQVFCDIFNLTNEPQEFYRHAPDRLSTKIFPETTFTFGVTGKF